MHAKVANCWMMNLRWHIYQIVVVQREQGLLASDSDGQFVNHRNEKVPGSEDWRTHHGRQNIGLLHLG